ncbi:MAG: hypothetical protein KAS32_23065 [Candidatus Peribacteraceae bacterium]|nr:hypothetical protein [Candidatus Peribacteraceae bacterium]
MWKLIQLLIFGHAHKWKIIQSGELTFTYSESIGMRYTLQCEKCGNIKTVDTVDG